MADFGNPVVVGGGFAVLSTDIFFAIVGAQFDAGRAASLALILTGFALAVFFLQQRLLGRGSYATVSGKGDAGLPMALPDGVRRLCLAVAGPWLLFTLVVYAFAFSGGFVQTWGRDYTPTLAHLRTAFDVQWGAASGAAGWVWAGTAWNSLFTTLKLAALAAPLCAGLGLLIAWLLARKRFAGQRAFEFAALLAFAVPGTVLGVSYILAFNVPPFELTGTGLIIVLCFVFRNLPVGVRAGAASLRQLDPSLDEASTLLGAGTATTLRRVVLPLLKPALVAALVYSFVRSMTTVSAVIFLVTAENELATTYIIGRVGNGDYGLSVSGVGRDETRRRARDALALVGLDGLASRATSELSGGQQQRVAVARALVLEPAVMLFDEPLSKLDARLRRSMREEIRALQQRLKLTVAYVTHDQAEALAVSDQIIVMDQGRIAQAGTPQQLYEQPASVFVAGFMGEAMLFEAEVGADGQVQLGPLRFTPARPVAPGPARVAVRPEAWRVAACRWWRLDPPARPLLGRYSAVTRPTNSGV